MTIYAVDISGSMHEAVNEAIGDMRTRVAADDTIILFTGSLHIHRNAGAFLRDPEIPPMGVAEMRDLYAWVAANAPGADLFVYSDGGMNEQHARIDAGRTFIMVVSTPVSNDLQRTFPGARIVPYADW